ncbi:MAG: GNAT family N-acetyltransferase [Nitrospiraceae bacterium]|nr:GNAT family N-acetyltransferase [Nitrospiraceae bacterium]
MGAVKLGDLRAPEKLSPDHDLAAFDSGEMVLDEWLRRRAAQNESSGASRTYVICAGKRVVGYYSLAVGAATHEQVAGRIKRNMPDPVPVMILGRLAVDRTFQGKGIGAGLLKDAVLRTLQAANIAGIRALLVHAISDAAKRFYEASGFIASPVDPMTVMITLVEAERIILNAKRSE